MVLQPDEAVIRTRAAHRLIPLLAIRRLLILLELVDHFAVQRDSRDGSVQLNVERVPLTGWLLRPLGYGAQRINRARRVPVVSARIYLHFITEVDAIKGIYRRLRQA